MTRSNRKLVFLASLPGAGGMLLQSIFAQNPELLPLPHSPFFEFFHATAALKKELYPAYQDPSSETYFNALLNGLLSGMQTNDPVRLIVDKTGTGPLEYVDLLQSLLPDVRIILFVRDLRAQLISLWLKSVGPETIDQIAVGAVISPQVIKDITEIPALAVGLNRVNKFLEQQINHKIFILSYEQLCLTPKTSLNMLYDYLELKTFNHDFKNISPLYSRLSSHIPDARIRRDLSNHSDRWMMIGQPGLSNYIIKSFNTYYKYLYPDVLNYRNSLRQSDRLNSESPVVQL